MNDKSQIETLAESMDVSAADVNCLARSVISSLEADKITDVFLSCDDDARRELTEAYVVHSTKKFQVFTNRYFSKPEYRNILAETVIGLVKNNR